MNTIAAVLRRPRRPCRQCGSSAMFGTRGWMRTQPIVGCANAFGKFAEGSRLKRYRKDENDLLLAASAPIIDTFLEITRRNTGYRIGVSRIGAIVRIGDQLRLALDMDGALETCAQFQHTM